MKHCGVVTDKSWHESDRERLEKDFANKHPNLNTGIWWGATFISEEDRPRIFSDEYDLELRKSWLINWKMNKLIIGG